MALINCPDCKNNVSTLAENCPHCGRPIKSLVAHLEKGGKNTPTPAGFQRIKAGEFTMGSPLHQEEREEREKPHLVKINRDFILKQTQVTQKEWLEIMGNNPSYFKNGQDDCPVEGISWFSAVMFCNLLSIQEGLEEAYLLRDQDGRIPEDEFEIKEVIFKGLNCKGYRLPTEAEWEYACRAGTSETRYGSLDQIAWYAENSEEKTHPVGQKQANAWGIYDMLGNVWEWCWDRYSSYPSGKNQSIDPTGPAAGTFRIMRGGGWRIRPSRCRAAYRGYDRPFYRYHFSFRPARTVGR